MRALNFWEKQTWRNLQTRQTSNFKSESDSSCHEQKNPSVWEKPPKIQWAFCVSCFWESLRASKTLDMRRIAQRRKKEDVARCEFWIVKTHFNVDEVKNSLFKTNWCQICRESTCVRDLLGIFGKLCNVIIIFILEVVFRLCSCNLSLIPEAQ